MIPFAPPPCCPNCGTRDTPDVVKRCCPSITFYNCQHCDFSTWERDDFNWQQRASSSEQRRSAVWFSAITPLGKE